MVRIGFLTRFCRRPCKQAAKLSSHTRDGMGKPRLVVRPHRFFSCTARSPSSCPSPLRHRHSAVWPSSDFTDPSIKGSMVKSEGIMAEVKRRRGAEEFEREAVRSIVSQPTLWPRWRETWGFRIPCCIARHPSLGRPRPTAPHGHQAHGGRGTHAREAEVGAGNPGAGFVKTCGGVLR